MNRMLPAALALACVASPAMAGGGYPAEAGGAHGLAMALTTFGAVSLGIALLVCIVRRLPIVGVVAAALVAVLISLPAFAAEVATVGNTAVLLPWGDIVVAIAQPVFAVLTSVIAGLVVALIAKFAPWLSTWITRVQIEGTLGRLEAYGLNATNGAAKGKTLSVDVGSEALARMVQYGADNAKPLVIKAAGGLPGLAEKLFRRLDLDEAASEANVLAPVKAQIAAGAIAKST